jgi:hypothetical protein
MEKLVDEALTRWHHAGLVDDRTLAAIRRFEESRPSSAGTAATGSSRRHGRVGLLAEGLAYLGAALAFGAGVALFSELWFEMGGTARTLTAAGGTLAVGGGAAALGRSDSPPVARLRSLLAALAIVGLGLTIGVGLTELTSMSEEMTTLIAGAVALVAAVPVHLARPSWPTALAAGAALMTATLAGEAVAGWGDNEVQAGWTMAALGALWAALGWLGLGRPRGAFEIPGLLTLGFGIQMLAFAAFPLAANVVGLAVAAAVLALGMVQERTSPAVLGGLGIAVFAPQVVLELFGDTIGGPLALFVGSLALVAAAVVVLRLRNAR